MAGVRLTQDIFLERCLSHLNSENYDFSDTKYVNCRLPVKATCKKHGVFSCNPRSLMVGSGCKICDKKSGKNPSANLSVDEYKIFASDLHNNKYDYSLVTTTRIKKIKIICPKHGEFLLRPSAHIAPKQMYGCQKCSCTLSKGEQKVIEYLKYKNINFIQQETFNNKYSIHRTALPYDFYLPELKTIIEFDGQQHFHPVRFGGQSKYLAKKQHKKIKLYDVIKMTNACLMKLKIIKISFHHFDKIFEILDNELYNNTYMAVIYDDKGRTEAWPTGQ